MSLDLTPKPGAFLQMGKAWGFTVPDPTTRAGVVVRSKRTSAATVERVMGKEVYPHLNVAIGAWSETRPDGRELAPGDVAAPYTLSQREEA